MYGTTIIIFSIIISFTRTLFCYRRSLLLMMWARSTLIDYLARKLHFTILHSPPPRIFFRPLEIHLYCISPNIGKVRLETAFQIMTDVAAVVAAAAGSRGIGFQGKLVSLFPEFLCLLYLYGNHLPICVGVLRCTNIFSFAP